MGIKRKIVAPNCNELVEIWRGEGGGEGVNGWEFGQKGEGKKDYKEVWREGKEKEQIVGVGKLVREDGKRREKGEEGRTVGRIERVKKGEK